MQATVTVDEDFFYSAHTLLRLWDMLEHPFCRRWAAGRVSAAEVAAYAGQHDYVVVVIARLADRAVAGAPEPVRDALRELSHAATRRRLLWRDFTTALGRPLGPPTNETARCLATWVGTGACAFARDLAVLFAAQSSLARASQPLLAGLHESGAVPQRAIDAFAAQAGLDGRDAEQARAVLESSVGLASGPALVGELGAALHTHWDLLGGVQRLCSAPAR